MPIMTEFAGKRAKRAFVAPQRARRGTRLAQIPRCAKDAYSE
jgi:hypothetical protein